MRSSPDVFNRVRKGLIEAARLRQTRTYGEVGSWVDMDADSQELRDLLGEVSEYEWGKKRPFLSAVAVYSESTRKKNRRNSPDGVRGIGIHNRAVAIGLDKTFPNYHLETFGGIQEEESYRFWRIHYAEFINDDKSTVANVSSPSHTPFFTIEEMNAYHAQAGIKYEVQAVGDGIKRDIVAKVRYWQERLLDRFGMAKTNVTDHWQQSGNVKKYIWGRLNRPEDDATDVFFTIDAMGSENRLKVRLGYNFGSSAYFSEYQKARLEEITGSNSDDRIFYVQTSELHSYDGWNSLLADTNAFIDRRWSDYEAAVAYVRGINHANVVSRSRTQLIPPAPNDSSEDDDTDNPIDPTGSGQDFAALAQRRHEIGEEGESYVLDVLAAEMPDWSFGTMIAGSRYDIKGTRGDTEILEIEVKSTTSTNKGAPFFLSSSELEYVKQTPNKYYLYRVTGLGTNQQKVAYRLTRDQLLARDMQCNGYMVASK